MNINVKKTIYLVIIIAVALVLARVLAAAISWIWSLVVGVAAVVMIVWIVKIVVSARR